VPINSAADLSKLWEQRALFYGPMHNDIDTLVNVYNGQLPEMFNDFFHEEMHVHIINMIRMAWDDLATLAGKEFSIFVDADNDTATAKERAERQEKIGYGYNRAGRRAGGVTMRQLMKVLMWWLVGTANSVLMTLPDFENKSPYFTFRDPRTHYPPIGWTPWNETRAEDALFVYQKTIAQLKIEYPDMRDTISQSQRTTFGQGYSSSRRGDDELYVWTGEYYHADCWMTAILSDTPTILAASEQGIDRDHPGVQPVTAMSLYNPTETKGRSIFADQVSVQAAMARMFSQKLDYYDRTLYPLIFTTPLAGKAIKVGPYAVNEFAIEMGVNPRVDAIGPTNTMDADQTMQFAVGMSRMLNRNPESMQGGGDADSAKAISKLQEGVQGTIKDYIWPIAIEVLPSAYANAARMDVKLWPKERKDAAGRHKGTSFRIPYTPMRDLKGREDDFDVEPGVGLAGYQGTLEILQLVQAELMPEDEALEQGEWTRNPQETLRRIDASRMKKLIWADLQAKAAQGQLKPGAMDKISSLLQKDGIDFLAAVRKLEEAGELVVTPEELMMQQGGMPPGAGGPPGAALGMGLPTPDMAALRG
jgi:hypothetical protein